MELALAILALAVGAVLGLVGYDLRARRRIEQELLDADKFHRTATADLNALHNKAVSEHAALVDRIASLEHMLTNRKSEPILKRF